MATTGMQDPIDPAAQANALADLFDDLSQAVDEFRLKDQDPPLTPAEASRLKDEAQNLENRAHHFTAEAIGATLQAIQPDLDKITTVTQQAAHQLKVEQNISRFITIATSVLSLGTAIAAGNPGSIAAAAVALGQTLGQN